MHGDIRADMSKLRGVFHDWAKAPKNWSITLDWNLEI